MRITYIEDDTTLPLIMPTSYNLTKRSQPNLEDIFLYNHAQIRGKTFSLK